MMDVSMSLLRRAVRQYRLGYCTKTEAMLRCAKILSESNRATEKELCKMHTYVQSALCEKVR